MINNSEKLDIFFIKEKLKLICVKNMYHSS